MSQRLFRTVLIFALLALNMKCTNYPDGLWPLQIFGKFSSSPNQKFLVYYDFNRDRHVDILTQSYIQEQRDIVNEGQISHSKILKQNTINIYLWNPDKKIFEVIVKNDFTSIEIKSVIATDFQHNGKIDLVIATQNLDKKIVILYYQIACIKYECSFYAKQEEMHVMTYSDNLPTVAQIMGRNLLISSSNNSLISTYYDQVTKKLASVEFQGYIEGEDPEICGKFHNLFYLDYNGDCMQDILIQCNNQNHELQFFMGKQNGKFEYNSKQELFKGQIGLETLNMNVRDINFDGLPDLVTLGYNNQTLKYFLEIHYNIGAKSIQESCTLKDKTLKFPYHFTNSPDELLNKIYKIQRIPVDFLSEIEKSQIILRFGDINNDGFTDLIIDGQNQAFLLYNELCDASCENQQYNLKFAKEWAIFKIRNFKKATIQYQNDSLNNKKLCSMSFFDFYEDGRLDIFGNQCLTNVTVGTIMPILNSLNLDVFFIKILMLNNLNNAKIQEKTIDFRFNSNGGHVDIYVTSLSGERMPAAGDQMSNPGVSLQLPFIHLGLGRTNNYVQQLVACQNRKEGQEKKQWTPIVPNSQLLIVPGPEQKWVLKTFISPTAVMGVVFWFVVLILIGMGIYIAHLTRKQKQEDKQNQQSFYAVLR